MGVVMVGCQVMEVWGVGTRACEGVWDPVGVQKPPRVSSGGERAPWRRWNGGAVNVHPWVLLFPFRTAILEPDFYLKERKHN